VSPLRHHRCWQQDGDIQAEEARWLIPLNREIARLSSRDSLQAWKLLAAAVITMLRPRASGQQLVLVALRDAACGASGPV
jgi:hypothetical protein